VARFRYAYREGSGKRLEAEISAESRDAVFAALRKRGIRPIKVVALDGSKANGEQLVRPLWMRAGIWAVVVLLAIVLGVAAFLAGRNGMPGGETSVAGHDGVGSTIATPLTRQTIPGNRMRIADAMNSAFDTQTEKALAQFAEPGREFYLSEAQPSQEDLKKALATPLMFGSSELSETIDLKRIVSGMKRELSGYIAAGGTWDDYLEQLVKRQKLEISYRQSAYLKIHAALDDDKPDKAKAYDIWLKANAQLQSMGIYPLPLPDTLRDYQFNLNIDE